MLFAVLCYEDNAVDRVRVWGERRQDQEALRHVEISSMAAVVGKAWRRATEEVAHGCGRGGGERRRAGHQAHFERGATGTGAGMRVVAGSRRKKGAAMGRRGGGGARAGRKRGTERSEGTGHARDGRAATE
jgi:hypothetical protein